MYQRGFMKLLGRMLGSKNENWVLQEEDYPKLPSRFCTDWKREKGITTLDWPSQSSDANPIMNVWGLLKSKREGIKLRNLKQLAAAIRKTRRKRYRRHALVEQTVLALLLPPIVGYFQTYFF